MNADITANRHHGNPASEAAFRKGSPHHQAARKRIFDLLSSSPAGMSSKEIAETTGWAMHTFSGRLTELKADGLIRGTGERRYGAEVVAVVRVPEQLSLLESVA